MASPQLRSPLLTGPQARGPRGLRRGRHGHGHHTLVRRREEPPQNPCCRHLDFLALDFSLGMMTVPRCSGPSHLLREQVELFPFFFPL